MHFNSDKMTEDHVHASPNNFVVSKIATFEQYECLAMVSGHWKTDAF